MYIIADGLARLLAPVLPVTTDELWRHLPGTREASVHLAEFPHGCRRTLLDPTLDARWERLMAIRDDVNRALEAERQAKTIGNSLGAGSLCVRRRRRRAARAVPGRPADAAHRLARSMLDRRPRRRQTPLEVDRGAGRRGQVPALLAHRHVESRPPRGLRPVRPLRDARMPRQAGRGMTRRDAAAETAAPTIQPRRAAALRPRRRPRRRGRSARRYARPLELSTMAVVVVVDQLTKAIVRRDAAAQRQHEHHSRSFSTSRTCTTPARRSAC